jgi:hypothetical protein
MKELLYLLRSNNFYGVSKEIEIAKGRYEYQTSIKQAWEQFKRFRKWQYKK